MPMMLDPGSPSGSSTSSRRTAHFIIEPASTEDVRRLVDIEFQAFEDERVNHQLSYRDHARPDHFERSVNLYTAAVSASASQQSSAKSRRRSDSRHSPTSSPSDIKFFKVTDAETTEIVSFAKMEFKNYSIDELLSPADIGHEREPKMNRDWFGLNERLRREYIGLAKHCYIGMLATQPCSQHNGAGTKLLKAVLQHADEAGVECYLEGTDTARFLYERYGFKAVNDIYFDPAQYGIEDLGFEHQTVMVRGAVGKDGTRRQVRTWDIAVAQAKAELQHAMGTR